MENSFNQSNRSIDENYEFNAPQYYDFLVGDKSSDRLADTWFDVISPIKNKKTNLFDKYTPKNKALFNNNNNQNNNNNNIKVNKQSYRPKRTLIENKTAEKHFEERNKKINENNNKKITAKSTFKPPVVPINKQTTNNTNIQQKVQSTKLTENNLMKPTINSIKHTSTVSSFTKTKAPNSANKNRILQEVKKRRESREKRLNALINKVSTKSTIVNPINKENSNKAMKETKIQKQETIKVTSTIQPKVVVNDHKEKINQLRKNNKFLQMDTESKISTNPSKFNNYLSSHKDKENKENQLHKQHDPVRPVRKDIPKLTSPQPFRFLTERRALMKKVTN